MACVRPYKDGWRLDYRDAEGNRYRRTYERKKDADAAAAKIKTQMGEGSFVAPKKIPTFRQVAEDWFSQKHNYRPASLSFWRNHLDRHLLPALGDQRLDRIDARTIEMFSTDRLAAKLGPKTVNKVLVTAAAIFTYAMKHKLCMTNPAKLADRVKENAGEITNEAEEAERTDDVVREDEVLSKSDLVRLLQHAAPGLYRTLLEAAAFMGCRHDELLALRWADIDLEQGRAAIRRALTWAKLPGDEKPRPRFFEPKTKAGRRVLPLPPGLVHALKVWKLQCPKGELGLVFPNSDGAPLHRSSVLRYGLHPACDRAKMRRISVLTLRHTFASQLLLDGAPLAEVQKLMGHAQPATTLRCYTHFVPRSETDAVARFATAVFALWTPDGHSVPSGQGTGAVTA